MASSSSPAQDTTTKSSVPVRFFNIMRKTYPDANAGLRPGRQRRTKGNARWECKICTAPWSSSSKWNALNHCRSSHEAVLNDPIASRPMQSFVTSAPSHRALEQVFDRGAYKEAMVALLTHRRMPLSAVEWKEFKRLALACNPAIGDYLLISRRSAVRLIEANYKLYAESLREGLSKAVSLIHLQSDLWTSPHRHSILAVCAQWIDHDYKLQKALLGLLECRDDHSGAAQAQLIMQVVKKYGIAAKIGWHTSDNATSNDTCLLAMETLLLESHGVIFKASQRRVRCVAHIVNLSLQAFLLASSKEALKAALDTASQVPGEDLFTQFSTTLAARAVADTGRGVTPAKRPSSKSSRGSRDSKFSGIGGLPCLQKLHSLAVWLRSSSLHMGDWDAAVGMRLGIDNATRWSSWFQVIDRALAKRRLSSSWSIMKMSLETAPLQCLSGSCSKRRINFCSHLQRRRSTQKVTSRRYRRPSILWTSCLHTTRRVRGDLRQCNLLRS